ncbi:MAG: DNA polymerase III subunit delta [Verrucomicrobiota bacterium]|nr:DNA polymerase III subunit delta [Limisphaera sp.]MDW8381440.1 DNA polymerase III subunit delta [Verrucomicrobiota bacterium]
MHAAVAPDVPAVMVCGDDELTVKERAARIFAAWQGGQSLGDEILDGAAGSVTEVLTVLDRAREALNTLPLPGSTKVVWLRNCTFLGSDRLGEAAAVTDALQAWARELQRLDWRGVRLLISAGRVDRRRTFVKVLEQIGRVEIYAAWSAEDRDWAERAAAWAYQRLREAGFEIDEEALVRLVNQVGPSPQLLHRELDKLCLYVLPRVRIGSADVAAVAVRHRTAQAFALADAVGDRDLPRALQCLEDELGSSGGEGDRSGLGILYGLAFKIRVLLWAKELVEQGWMHPEADYSTFKARLLRIPQEHLATDRRLTPLGVHPFVLHKAMRAARNYSRTELVRAMKQLLECNQAMVSSRLAPALLLQRLLVGIIGGSGGVRTPSP